MALTDQTRSKLRKFFNENPQVELVNAYLFYLQTKFNIQPVVFPKEKLIYKGVDELIRSLESKGELWKETEIKIVFGTASVNEHTKKVYICPFTGKVFGDNTHPNPQDAIYDWVSKCPENTERQGGVKVKRFFVSEDLEVIQNYISKNKIKEPIKKVVYSSVLSGKLFNSRESVIEDFRRNYVKPMSLIEVQNQNRFQIEQSLLEFIQAQLVEEKVTAFIEALAEEEEFLPHVQRWLG
jgi:hypothetical protein